MFMTQLVLQDKRKNMQDLLTKIVKLSGATTTQNFNAMTNLQIFKRVSGNCISHIHKKQTLLLTKIFR